MKMQDKTVYTLEADDELEVIPVPSCETVLLKSKYNPDGGFVIEVYPQHLNALRKAVAVLTEWEK